MRDAAVKARGLNFTKVAFALTPRGAGLLCSPAPRPDQANQVIQIQIKYLAQGAAEVSGYAATRMAAARTSSPTASS